MTKCIQEEKKHCIFTICPCPAQDPIYVVHEIYNLVKLSLGLHYYILNLSDTYPSVYKKRKRNNAFSINYILPHLNTNNPSQGVMKFTTLVDPSLVIINMYLVCLNHEPA